MQPQARGRATGQLGGGFLGVGDAMVGYPHKPSPLVAGLAIVSLKVSVRGSTRLTGRVRKPASMITSRFPVIRELAPVQAQQAESGSGLLHQVRADLSRPHAFVIVSGRRRTATVTGCDRSLSHNAMGLAMVLARAHRTSSTRLDTPILSNTPKR